MGESSCSRKLRHARHCSLLSFQPNFFFAPVNTIPRWWSPAGGNRGWGWKCKMMPPLPFRLCLPDRSEHVLSPLFMPLILLQSCGSYTNFGRWRRLVCTRTQECFNNSTIQALPRGTEENYEKYQNSQPQGWESKMANFRLHSRSANYLTVMFCAGNKFGQPVNCPRSPLWQYGVIKYEGNYPMTGNAVTEVGLLNFYCCPMRNKRQRNN